MELVERIAHVTGQRRRKKVYMVSERAMDQALGVRDAVSRSESDGVRIEDLVAVTAKGCRILSRSPKELIVIK